MLQAAFDRLPELATALQRLCREGRSGVLHIVTSDNHTALFGLIAGEIVTVRYRIRKDTKALEYMLNVSGGRYRFEEDAPTDLGGALPSTENILSILGAGTPEPSAASAAAPSQPVSLNATQQLPSTIQTGLVNILASYAGPAANLMARSVFANTSDPNEAITLLARKLPNPAQARAFSSEARSKLRTLL